MTTFTDGPAAGKVLMLRRAPIFLRVVIDEEGKVDALDQLSDTPRLGETVLVYNKTIDKGSIHINSRDAKTGRCTGGFFRAAEYALVESQPEQEVLRFTTRWQAWAEAQLKEGEE